MPAFPLSSKRPLICLFFFILPVFVKSLSFIDSSLIIQWIYLSATLCYVLGI